MPALASQINPLDLEKLAQQSELILVGVVTAMPKSDDVSDTISVRVISSLKGKTTAKSFTLRLANKGVKDFDPKLAAGEMEYAFDGVVWPDELFKLRSTARGRCYGQAD